MRRVVALLAASVFGCSSPDHNESTTTAAVESCDPVALAAAVATPDTKDCGSVALEGDPRPAWDCATKAFRAGVPFRVSESLRGFDSTITFAVVRNPDGTVEIISRGSDPVTERDMHGAPTITRVTCKPGAVVTSQRDGIERVECTGSWATSKRDCK